MVPIKWWKYQLFKEFVLMFNNLVSSYKLRVEARHDSIILSVLHFSQHHKHRIFFMDYVGGCNVVLVA